MSERLGGWIGIVWAQCWQVTALIVVVWVTTRLLARSRPHLACALWLVVLFKCVTPPIWSSPSGIFCWVQQTETTHSDYIPLSAKRIAPLPSPDGGNDAVVVQMPATNRPATNASPLAMPAMSRAQPPQNPEHTGSVVSAATLAGWCGTAWLIGFAGYAGVTFLRWRSCWRKVHWAGEVKHPVLAKLLEDLKCKLSLRRSVRLLVTRACIGPAVVGLWRPIVILPLDLVCDKSPTELEPLLAHELIHIRRGDLWVSLLQTLARMLWWFHPLVGMASRVLSREAERCCDEAVIAYLGCEPAAYARSLIDVLALKKQLQPVPACPGVRPVEVTSQRLERIMRLRQGCHKKTPWWCWLAMFLLAVAVLPGAALVVRAKEKVRKQASGTGPRIVIGTTMESSSRAMPAVELSTTIYKVSDLLAQFQKEQHASADEARAALLPLLTSTVPGPWESSDSDSAKCAASWAAEGLLIRQTKEGHKQIDKQLQFWKEFGFQKLAIEVRMLSASAKVMDTNPANWQVIDAGAEFDAADSLAKSTSDAESFRSRVESVIEKTHPAMFAILDESAAARLLTEAQGDARSNVLQAPKITLYNGQSSRVEDLAKRPFVVAVRQVGEDSHEPLIRVVEVGSKLRLRPKLARNGSVEIDFGLTMSDVRSVETFDLPTSRPPKITVQVPEVATIRIESTVSMKVDQTLVIRILQPGENNSQSMWVLVKVRKVATAVNPAEPATKTNRVTALDSKLDLVATMQPETKSISGAEFIKGWQFRFSPRSGAPWQVRSQTRPGGKGTDCHISGGIRVEAQARDSSQKSKSFVAEADELEYSSDVQSLQLTGNVHFSDAQSEMRCRRLRIRFPHLKGSTSAYSAEKEPASTFELDIDEAQSLSLTDPLDPQKPVANTLVTGAAHLSEPLIEKVYPVADLVIPVSTEPTIISLDGKLTANTSRPQLKPDAEALLNLVTTTISPDSWATHGGLGTIALSENTLSLVIHQEPAIHKRIAELFKQLRHFQDVQILYTLERLQVDSEKLDRWASDNGGVFSAFASMKVNSVSLSSKEVGRLRDSLTPKSLGNCPKITVFNGQQIELSHREFNGPRLVPGLQLLGVIAADIQSFRITIGAGSGDGEFKRDARSESQIVKHGNSVLIDVTQESWESKEKQAIRMFYLLTPRMMMSPEVDSQTGALSPRK